MMNILKFLIIPFIQIVQWSTVLSQPSINIGLVRGTTENFEISKLSELLACERVKKN